jgi:hypothetical protein
MNEVVKRRKCSRVRPIFIHFQGLYNIVPGGFCFFCVSMWHGAYTPPITGFPHLHIILAESIPPASAAKPGDEYFLKL